MKPYITWIPQSFLCQGESRWNTHLETDASAGSKKPGALDPLIPRLESVPIPLEEFWYIIKNKVLMDPRGRKRDQTDCLCCGRNCPLDCYRHVHQLVQKSCQGPFIVSDFNCFPFILCELSWNCMLSMWIIQKSLLLITTDTMWYMIDK